MRSRLAVLALSCLLTSSLVAEDATGEQLYQQHCARCHGAHGEGTEKVPAQLIGDRSLKELTALIDETMPEDDPAKCVGADAEKVAAYIHESFYSIIAQERNRPARVELSHLTVRQHENAITDILQSFYGESTLDESRGLKAEYYKERRRRKESRVIERSDNQVDFQFGEGTPDPLVDNKEEFSIEWEGSLLAPETGLYDFIVETENGGRFFLNNEETPFIDASVRSGDQKEYTGSMRLLAGRAYRLRLEFFKAKEKTASIRLKWKLPHRPVEVIPQRYLSPQWSPRSFVLSTPFPPDDRSRGYDRGSAVSKEWYEATTAAALETAATVVRDLDRLSKSKPEDGDRSQKVQEFCAKFAARAVRRPIDDAEKQFYVTRHFAEGGDVDTATRRAITMILQSPRFLYREVNQGPFDDFDAASWLAFSLWDSIPDQQLLDAAGRGQLKTADQLTRQAERMLQSPKARAKVSDFIVRWLRLDHHQELSKDPQAFPQFTPEIASDLRTSLDLFVDEVIWKRSGDFRELLSSDQLYLNGRLAAVYGADLAVDAAFQPVSLSAQSRAGILSHPLLLACLAYERNSSPIHRGVWVSRGLLGRRLKAPPVAVAPLAPDLNPELTTRERVAIQTSPQACQTCHAMVNPLGFTLENFDAIGRFRTEEQGKPIDASGSYISRSGDEAKFATPKEFASYLIASPECHEAFVEQLFHHLAKQPVRAFGNEFLTQRTEAFRGGEFNIRKLLVDLTVQSTLVLQKQP